MTNRMLPHGNDPACYRDQTDNAVEQLFRKDPAVRNWLRTCGPTSATMLVAATRGPGAIQVGTLGGWEPQPEDVLTLFFNDPRSRAGLLALRQETDPAQWFGNEIPQFYPAAIRDVYGANAVFEWGVSGTTIRKSIDAGRGVMVALKSPGHYLALIGYEVETDVLIYHDPWPGDVWPPELKGTPGAYRRVKAGTLESNVKPFRVEIW